MSHIFLKPTYCSQSLSGKRFHSLLRQDTVIHSRPHCVTANRVMVFIEWHLRWVLVWEAVIVIVRRLSVDERVVSFSRHMRRINAAIIAVPVSRNYWRKQNRVRSADDCCCVVTSHCMEIKVVVVIYLTGKERRVRKILGVILVLVCDIKSDSNLVSNKFHK